ncbi:MAG TPA: NFACT family protein [Candidatus Nanoarchaeia archaeon]|nr:NFACT family protein [Candidatus Nanoarchaeia archaeon]
MKSLSSIDVHYLVQELKSLEGSRVDNIYQKAEEFLIQMHKSGDGKKLLKIIVGKSLFLASLKDEMESLSGFCMLLRKYLGNAVLASLSQIEPERIVRLEFDSKAEKAILYLEFFGKGNVILCKEGDIIIDALTHHEFKDRKVEPKALYSWPKMGYNAYSMEQGYLSSLLSSTTRESLVKCIAIDLGFGGIYAEEACARASIDKGTKSSELSPDQARDLLLAIKGMTEGKANPVIYLREDKVIDVFPFPLQTLSGTDMKPFGTLSEALEHYALNVSTEKKTSYDAKLEEVSRIIESQRKNIAELEQEESENREKAEAIYSNYAKIAAILNELKEISRKHSWQDIKAKLKDHPLIKEVNPKEKSVVLELP